MTNMQLLNKTIQSLGILKRYKGYKQLMMSVELALDDEERLMYITKTFTILLRICAAAIATILSEISEPLPNMHGSIILTDLRRLPAMILRIHHRFRADFHSCYLC